MGSESLDSSVQRSFGGYVEPVSTISPLKHLVAKNSVELCKMFMGEGRKEKGGYEEVVVLNRSWITR